MPTKQFSIIIMLLAAGPTVLICQQATFVPVRYEQFIDRTIKGLQEKSRMLEQKLQSSKDHQARALKSQAQAPRRASLYETIIEANESVIKGLESARMSVQDQLKRAQEEKGAAQQTIKNKENENLLMRKTELRLSIADLQMLIDETHRTENFLRTQKANKAATEITKLNTFIQSWINKRSQLELKLRNEQTALQRLG